MEAHYNWEQPTPPEEERFEIPRRTIWYMLKSYIVKANEFESLFAWAAKQNFMGRWMPESGELYRVFLGEFHWAPAYTYHNKPYYGQQGWTGGDRRQIPGQVLPTATIYTGEGNSFDCSLDETVHIYLPCKSVADNMGLKWTGSEGQFSDEHGQLVAFDPSVNEAGPGALLMKKDRIIEFLDQNGYAIIWTLLGEKYSVGGRDLPRDWKGRLEINGAFALQNGNVCGTRWTTFKAPR